MSNPSLFKSPEIGITSAATASIVAKIVATATSIVKIHLTMLIPPPTRQQYYQHRYSKCSEGTPSTKIMSYHYFLHTYPRRLMGPTIYFCLLYTSPSPRD